MLYMIATNCTARGMCGRSPTGGEKVLATDHQALEHLAEDSPLAFCERVYEHCNTDPCCPARLRDFARFARAKQCLPRERRCHLGRTTVRDTPPLDMPAHYPPAVSLHESRQHVELRAELSILRREQAHERHVGARHHGGRRPDRISPHEIMVPDGTRASARRL
jgi:hypothetical protein